MSETDKDYHRQREQIEREREAEASDPAVVVAHKNMADRYAALAAVESKRPVLKLKS